MALKSLVLFTLLLFTKLTAYEIADENETVARTCRISVKGEVIPDEQMVKSTGRAIVYVNLTDDEGNPYRQERVVVTANGGTFVCGLPEDDVATDTDSSADDCFVTGYDGVAKIYFVNIPINVPIRINAYYTCDDRKVSGFATMSISRKSLKKKRRVNPR